jgi:hypothetical protein
VLIAVEPLAGVIVHTIGAFGQTDGQNASAWGVIPDGYREWCHSSHRLASRKQTFVDEGLRPLWVDSGRSCSLTERHRPEVFVAFTAAAGASHPENIIEVFFSAADLTSTPLSGANIA